MKKIIATFLIFVLIFGLIGCDTLSETNSKTDSDISSESSSKTSDETKVLLVENEDVKISLEGLSSRKELFEVGEGIKFLVENLRSESIIISVSEVSVNDMMKTVIQPQMPNNIISAGKSSIQTIIFQDAELENAVVELKFHVLNENYKEISVTDFIIIDFSN